MKGKNNKISSYKCSCNKDQSCSSFYSNGKNVSSKICSANSPCTMWVVYILTIFPDSSWLPRSNMQCRLWNYRCVGETWCTQSCQPESTNQIWLCFQDQSTSRVLDSKRILNHDPMEKYSKCLISALERKFFQHLQKERWNRCLNSF